MRRRVKGRSHAPPTAAFDRTLAAVRRLPDQWGKPSVPWRLMPQLMLAGRGGGRHALKKRVEKEIGRFVGEMRRNGQFLGQLVFNSEGTDRPSS